MKTTNEEAQQELAQRSNKILEDDEDVEVVETTTKFEFNLGFAKVSRSVKKIKK
jgi:hypothetical protein